MQMTPAERAVFQLWTDGNSTADIANRLGIRQSAVEAVLMSVLDNMAAVDRLEPPALATHRASLDSGDTRRGPPSLANGEEAAGA
jgi:DNA-binding NarL/FixJ family response regulator